MSPMIIRELRQWIAHRFDRLEATAGPGMDPTEEDVVRRFKIFQSSDSGHELLALLRALPSEWQPFLLGGLLRELALRRPSSIAFSDLDIVIGKCPSREALFAVLRPFLVRRNRFGGAKCRIPHGTLLFDIWRIEDHAVAAGRPTCRDIQDLLANCLTNIDAISLNLHGKQLIDGGCLAGLRSGTIHALTPLSPIHETGIAQAVHLLLLAEKYTSELQLDGSCHSLLREASERFGVESLLALAAMRLQERAHPKPAVTLAAMRQLLTDLGPVPVVVG